MPLIAEPQARALRRAPPFILAPNSHEMLGPAGALGISLTSPASATYPTSNLLIALPFVLRAPAIAYQLAALNGASVSGNIDMGILDESGNRLVSAGSTQQANTNVPQIFNITDTALAPDTLYYLAVAMDNTTGTLFRQTSTNAEQLRAFGMRQVASSFAIPSSNTLVAIATNYLPWIGVDLRGSTF